MTDLYTRFTRDDDRRDRRVPRTTDEARMIDRDRRIADEQLAIEEEAAE